MQPVYSIFHGPPRLGNGNATRTNWFAGAVKFHTVTPMLRVTAETNLKIMKWDWLHLGNTTRLVETSVKIT